MYFVIIAHSCPYTSDHFDLMLEKADYLETYRIDSLEKLLAGGLDILKIQDHDKKFLKYEGPVNKGKGNVVQIDKGQYSIQGDMIELKGKVVCGTFHLNFIEENRYHLA